MAVKGYPQDVGCCRVVCMWPESRRMLTLAGRAGIYVTKANLHYEINDLVSSNK